MWKASLRAFFFTLIVVTLKATGSSQAAPNVPTLDRNQVAAIRTYIASAWDNLTRSMTNCKTVVDPKIPSASVL